MRSVDVIVLKAVYPDGVDYGYAHHDDAGIDLRASEDFIIEPGERALVGTGLKIALPDGYAAFVMPRSGLAVKHGITVLNSPGVIDAGYRGEIMVPLLNTDKHQAFKVQEGDRIAQLVIMPVTNAVLHKVESLDDTERGANGFGSTGVE